MENGIKKILRDKYGLFEKDIEILLEKFTKFSVPKREIILQERQTDHYIYFVEKGIVKSTILRESRQSLYTLEAVDTCILWRISRKDLATSFKDSLNLSNWGRMILQEWLTSSSFYFSSIHWMSKKEQYQYLLKEMPKLIQRLSMRDLSAWLDITPQSLSRIRADMH
ncbi:Crp/Fnr family transcriptional regulator [Bacteroides fragilis]|nr:Crp/Fnr family transcriptional regulator [Bacteroides fragilis]